MSFSDTINATTINASNFYKDGEELKHDHIASGDIMADNITVSNVTTSNQFRGNEIILQGNCFLKRLATNEFQIQGDNNESGNIIVQSGNILVDVGNIGIGTDNPGAPLHIVKDQNYYITDSDTPVFFVLLQAKDETNLKTQSDVTDTFDDINRLGIKYTATDANKPLSIACEGSIWTDDVIFISSDSRIKKNIVEMNRDFALNKLRDISCCSFNYIDPMKSGNSLEMGFIAQQVKEHLPEAVTQKKSIIPNEMRILRDVIWNNTKMSSNSLSDVSGVKYRFYVSNDTNGSNEVMKEIIGNSDNTFTFDKRYNNVICYGKEVNDFNILNEQKLFALNFSATQEIDRIQQNHKHEIAELNNKVISLQNQLETVLKRLDNLETN